VFTDLVLAVEVGIILAMLNFLRRMSSTVEVRPLAEPELGARIPGNASVAIPEGVLVYTVDGPFFFGAVDQFEQALLHTHTEPAALVISLARVPFIDLTGLASLAEVFETLARRGIRVALCHANEDVAGRLERAHIVGALAVPPSVDLAAAIESVRPTH
jgi:SulP family sulfate permease